MRTPLLLIPLLLVPVTGCGKSPLESERHLIRFEVREYYHYSSATPYVDISYRDGEGNLHLEEGIDLPWIHSLNADSGTFLLISVRRNPPFSGNVEVLVYLDGDLMRTGLNPDPYSPVTIWFKVP